MKQHCSGQLYHGRTGSFSCSSPATRQYKDKWWCFQHDPREKEKKRQKLEENWKRELQEDSQKQHKADQLLKRLGVRGSVGYHWKRGYLSAIIIGFDEVEKLLKKLNK